MPVKYLKLFLISFVTICLGGCSWFGWAAHKTPSVEFIDIVSVDIIQENVWILGGEMVFVPFTSGANAEAGRMVDHLALVMVKGFADYMSENPGVFKLLTAEEAQYSRFVIEGRIDEFNTGGKFKKLGIGKKETTLKISGEIRDRKTGEIVARINGNKSFQNINEADQAAEDMGFLIAAKVQH